jgi:hypothetical protein
MLTTRTARSEKCSRNNSAAANGYSITSSAMASSVGGTVRPSALAVFRLPVQQLPGKWMIRGLLARLVHLVDWSIATITGFP